MVSVKDYNVEELLGDFDRALESLYVDVETVELGFSDELDRVDPGETLVKTAENWLRNSFIPPRDIENLRISVDIKDVKNMNTAGFDTEYGHVARIKYQPADDSYEVEPDFIGTKYESPGKPLEEWRKNIEDRLDLYL